MKDAPKKNGWRADGGGEVPFSRDIDRANDPEVRARKKQGEPHTAIGSPRHVGLNVSGLSHECDLSA